MQSYGRLTLELGLAMTNLSFTNVTDFANKYHDTRLEEWWVAKIQMPGINPSLDDFATLYVILIHMVKEMGAKFQQIYVGPGDGDEWQITLTEATEWNG